MARTTERGAPESVGLPTVGHEGDVCAQCGSVLAIDQRYCLNCGWRRGEPRVDYESRMINGAPPAAPAPQAPAPSGFQQSPIFAVGTIALLGIMLLLGVLIGKDDGGTQTVAAAPAQTTTPATTATPTPTESAAAAPPAKAKKAETAPGEGNVVQGGTGSTEGVQQVDTEALENAAQSGQGAQAGKNLPDQVATGGEAEKLDPGGQAGGGSGSTCIGC
jgi:hypothetical protein